MRAPSHTTIRVPPISPLGCGILATAFLVAAAPTPAQWQVLPTPTTADLRGIHSIGNGIAWASGANGTVLRTTDDGAHWQLCPTPPGAEHLDFRGIRAFDDKTAIVMSSGKGDLSRLYKTTDACQTWALLFTNPDPEGFWDAITAKAGRGFLIGDPVEGRFVLYASMDGAFEHWERFGEKVNFLHFPYNPASTETLFAASNSGMEGDPISDIAFVTGGESGSHFYLGLWNGAAQIGHIGAGYFEANLPLAKGANAGAFSMGGVGEIRKGRHYVVVGGDYTKVDFGSGVAAYSNDGGQHFKAAKLSPHGFRSAVAYDPSTKTWITVGPNGTDISTDDGRNWRALRPNPALNEPPDADRDWNALSLPFVVGPHGRIGKLRPETLTPPQPTAAKTSQP